MNENEHHDEVTELLAVADWTVDPFQVATALRLEGERAPIVADILVPTTLSPLDWIGDPHASRPCAERQLDELRRLAKLQGVGVVRARVGDPEWVASIHSSAEGRHPDRILLFDRNRRLSSHPLSVARRVARKLGRPVERIVVPPAPTRGSTRRPSRCAPAAAWSSQRA
jgi:hypothetical protein